MGYADQPGVIPRAVEDLFSRKSLLKDELRVWASFVEIYNEQTLASKSAKEVEVALVGPNRS